MKSVARRVLRTPMFHVVRGSILIQLCCATALAVGCSDDTEVLPTSTNTTTERKPGERAPITRDCDDLDPSRCLLPWPSSAFMKADSTTETKLRVSFKTDSLAVADDPVFMNTADGFSRLSQIETGFLVELDPATVNTDAGSPLHLIVSQPDSDSYGKEVPLIVRLVSSEKVEGEGKESLILGAPMRPLEAAAEHVAYLLDDVKTIDGAAVEVPRSVKVALGLTAPSNEAETKLFAYHGPTRTVLKSAGVDLTHVARVWDFTTRSATDTAKRLAPMRKAAKDAVAAGNVGVVIDSVELGADTSSIGAIVLGHLTGVPSFQNADKSLKLDSDGKTSETGVREARFRVMIPKGTAPTYRTILFGHGTGGEVTDSNFDEDLAKLDIGKVNLRFEGWTENEVANTFLGFADGVMKATFVSTSQLDQALANGAAIQASLETVLGDAVAADTIGGQVNPGKGRRPDMTLPIWAGGSMGGTMGFVIANADEKIRYAVLNVPGAAWTHWVPYSSFYNYVKPFLENVYGTEFDARMVLAMTQTQWDDIDGAAWIGAVPDDKPVYLIQESMGDPVIPNQGTNLLATAVNATQVGPILASIPGLEKSDSLEEASGITQYSVPLGDDYSTHGFADCKNTAGDAARQQIYTFFTSTWAGKTKIEFPQLCVDSTQKKDCDFSGMWDGNQACDRL